MTEPSIQRVTRTKRQAQATYDKLAPWYDWIEGNWETRLRVLGLQKLCVQQGETVLEIGVGTGHSLEWLARTTGAAGQVLGLDLSPRMLDVSRQRTDKLDIAARVALIRGDAVRIPFATHTVDAIFMSFVLELFDTPEIPQVLRECHRVLKAGGRIGIVSLSKSGRPSRLRDLYEWGHDHYPNVLDCRPIYVQTAIRDAGFQTLDANLHSLWGLPIEIVIAKKQNGS
jgi:demethylmenaquinone methyltransferase/2-methoxy-6-polyprenyl-1,4-benzoquinol methylase